MSLMALCLAPHALVVSARAATASANTPAEPSGYWLGASDSPVPVTLHGATVMQTKPLAALLRHGHAVIVDVSSEPRRPPQMAPGAPWLPLPHDALPDAIWVPGVGAGSIAPGLDDWFRGRLAQASDGDLNTRLVIYCHEACWLSWNAAKRAVGYGYRHVYWFKDGVEGWTRAGYPTMAVKAEGPGADVASADAAGADVASAVASNGSLPRLVVLDLELSGDTGGPEMKVEHDARLEMESARLRKDLENTHRYEVLDNAPAEDMIERLRSQQEFLHDCNGCDLDVGRALHADQVLVAWVDRVSGLILTLTYELHDVSTGQIAARKSYDFRGDSDIAWNHAIDYMVRDRMRDMSIVSEH